MNLIIDAGHKGIEDFGKISRYQIAESDAVFVLSKYLFELAPDYNLNPILTRKSRFHPISTKSRILIANSVKPPKIFITLHLLYEENRKKKGYLLQWKENCKISEKLAFILDSYINKKEIFGDGMLAAADDFENKKVLLNLINCPGILFCPAFISYEYFETIFFSNLEFLTKSILESICKVSQIFRLDEIEKIS